MASIVAHGIDYSAGRPTIAEMKANGLTFVVRYVSDGNHPKEISHNEASFWRASGINVVIVNESTAGRALEGFAAGHVDALTARADVVNAGGPTNGGVIYFAVDVDTTNDQQRAAACDYLRGAASVLGWAQVGVYGEYELMVYVSEHTPCQWYWQTYAWSHGLVFSGVALYQYLNGVKLGNTDVDLDYAYSENYGQWFHASSGGLMATDVQTILAAIQTLSDKVDAVQRGLSLALYGDSRDDAKDAGTHPENLQAIAQAVAEVNKAVGKLPTSTTGTGTLHVSGDLTVT